MNSERLPPFQRKIMWAMLIVIASVCVMFWVVSVSAYPKTQDGFKQSLQQASVWTIENMSSGYEDLNISDFEDGTTDGWSSWIEDPYKDNLTITTNNCLTNYCLNWTYNYSSYNSSSPKIGYRIITKSFTNLDGSNYTGIGFWYKGDKRNYFQIKLVTYINGTTKAEHQSSSGGEVTSYYTDGGDWKYYYYDFSWLRNESSSDESMPREFLNNVTKILIVIFNGSSTDENINGEIIFDNLSLVNFDKGGIYRTLNPTLNERNGRYQEGVYNLAYLYYNGLTGYSGNETLLNKSIEMGDWLVRNQMLDGGWQEYGLQTTSSSASTGFPGISFMKTLELVKEEPIMQENVTTYRLGNITTKTRIELWNETAELMANYTLNFDFPESWYSNQYFGRLHATWLYANYSGKWDTYNNKINSELTTINNTWQLNRFGFTPESNSTSKIGIDNGYFHVSTFMYSAFYQDSKNPILGDIIKKEDKAFLNIIGSPHDYSSYLINGSRDTGEIKSTTSTEYSYNITTLLNIPYHQQAMYNRQESISSFGDFSKTTFTRGIHWDVMRVPFIEATEFVDTGFKFPQNYSHYSYNLFNETSWTRNNNSISGPIQSISQLEFPQIYYAWDDDGSYWNWGDEQGTFNITNFDNSNLLMQELNGLTNAQIVYDNGTYIDSINGNYNLSLSPNQYAYVYDECIIPHDGMTILESTIFCEGTYNLNGSSSGAITIGDNNIVLDGGGSILQGNWTQTGNNGAVVILSNSKSNLTIQNITIMNYERPVKLQGANSLNGTIKDSNFTMNRMAIWLSGTGLSGNSFIKNNYFSNNSYAAVWIQGTSEQGLTIKDNVVYQLAQGHEGIREESTSSKATNITIMNNTFYKSGDVQSPSIKQVLGNNWIILNNTVYGAGNLYEYGIRVNGQNNTVSYNYIDQTQYGLSILEGSYNSTFSFNTIRDGDMGSEIINSNFIYYLNNTIINMSDTGMDSYYIGLRAVNNSNLYVKGNNFTNIPTVGALFVGNRNLTISDNYFQMMTFQERIDAQTNDGYEPQCVIQATKRYKGYEERFGNDNVTITNNVMVANDACYLDLENVTNLQTDLTNYWYRSFTTNVSYSGKYEFYVPIENDNVSRYSSAQGYRNDFRISNSSGDTSADFQYNIFKDYSYFKNLNQNGVGGIFLNVSSLNDALAYNENLSIYGSANIEQNDNEINFVLFPSNGTFVLDDYNWTLGVTRMNDPAFNGTYLENNLDQTILVQISDFNTLRNAQFTTGASISSTRIGMAPGDYSYVY